MRHLFFILFLFLSLTVFGQSDFNLMYNQGLRQEHQQLYYKAILSYTAAISMTDNQSNVQKAKKRIDYCANRLEKLKREAEQARKKAEEEKMRADSALLQAQIAKRKTDSILKIVKAQYQQIKKEQRIKMEMQQKSEKLLNTLLSEDPEKVFALDVAGLGLSELSGSFEFFPNLIEINASDNKLNYLPYEIIRLKYLVKLDISNNVFEELSSVYDIHELTVLRAKSNSIKNLAGISSLTTIEILDLADNELNSLPEEFSKLKYLYYLDLSANNFTEVPDVLKSMKTIRYINLSGNSIPLEEINQLRQELPNCTIKF